MATVHREFSSWTNRQCRDSSSVCNSAPRDSHPVFRSLPPIDDAGDHDQQVREGTRGGRFVSLDGDQVNGPSADRITALFEDFTATQEDGTETGAENWSRLVRSKKDEYYNLYRIWPHLHRYRGCDRTAVSNNDSLEAVEITALSSSNYADGPPYDQPYKFGKPNNTTSTASSSATQSKFIQNKASGGVKLSVKCSSFTHNNNLLWESLSTAYGQMLVIFILVFYSQIFQRAPEDVAWLEKLQDQHDIIVVYLSAAGCCLITGFYVNKLMKAPANSTWDARPSSSDRIGQSSYIRISASVFGVLSGMGYVMEFITHLVAAYLPCPHSEFNQVSWSRPLLQSLSTLLQTLFLFVHTADGMFPVDKFGGFTQLCFAHLTASNIISFSRLVLWEPNHGHVSSLMLHCLPELSPTNLWHKTLSYLAPFLVTCRLKMDLHFSLFAAVVTYALWSHAGCPEERRERVILSVKEKPTENSTSDCRGMGKGLYLGLTSLTIILITIAAYFVKKDEVEFRPGLSCLIIGCRIVVLCMSALLTVVGFFQLPKLSKMEVHCTSTFRLDNFLIAVTSCGVFLHAISALFEPNGMDSEQKVVFFIGNILVLVQSTLQGAFIAEAQSRFCSSSSRYQLLFKPARQIITYLVLSNVGLWLMDLLVDSQAWLSWWMAPAEPMNGLASTVSFTILYRFHSALLLTRICRENYSFQVNSHR